MCCASVSWIDQRRITRWGQALWASGLFILTCGIWQLAYRLWQQGIFTLKTPLSDSLTCWMLLVGLRWYVTFVNTLLQRPAIKTLHHHGGHWSILVLEKLLWGLLWLQFMGALFYTTQEGHPLGIENLPWYFMCLGCVLECLTGWVIVTLGRGYGEVAAVRVRRTSGAYRWYKHPQAVSDHLRMAWFLGLLWFWHTHMLKTGLITEASAWTNPFFLLGYWGLYLCVSYRRIQDETTLFHSFDETF